MADRYEEIARGIVDRHFPWPTATGSPAGAPHRLTAAIVAALREQDTWYEIDDPEHPAPRDGTELIGLGMDTNIFRVWRGHTERGAPAWVSFGGPFTDGYITHWRPMPLSPPPQSVRQDASPSPDAGAPPPAAGDGSG